MSQLILERVRKLGDQLTEQAASTEENGCLPTRTAAALREAGVMRALQPAAFGGFEAHPADYAEAVMEVAGHCGATGWVTGTVGLHPWVLTFFDEKLHTELWGEDPDTWVASPFSPNGLARPVDGGYELSGRWQYSSGTDHCSWVVLGALVSGPDGKPVMPPQMLNVVLPRTDYEIIDGTWDVAGLSGTGSKDVVVRNAFVPAHRTHDANALVAGEIEREQPLYRMPWSAMAPLGLTAAVIGACEGVLASHQAIHRDKPMPGGGHVREDPYHMSAIGEAASELAASRIQLLDNVNRLFDVVAAGGTVSFAHRAACRRDQVRAAWRAVSAADEIFSRAGASALRRTQPVQRFWRDAHAGLNHILHTPGAIYHAAAQTAMDVEPRGALRRTI